MSIVLWIIYFVGFGGLFFKAVEEIGDEGGGLFAAVFIAMLWPVELAFGAVVIGIGLWRDRAHIRWPWQPRSPK